MEKKLYNTEFSNANGRKDESHYKGRVGASLENSSPRLLPVVSISSVSVTRGQQ